MRTRLTLALKALGRRDGRVPGYRGPLGLWKVLLMGVLVGALFEVDDLAVFLLLMAGLIGWAAPLAAARYAAAALGREREVGSLGPLVQACGPLVVLLAAGITSALGPALEVMALALLVAWTSPFPAAVAGATALLVFEVLAAGVVGAWIGARSAGVREALQRVGMGPVLLYLSVFAVVMAEGPRHHVLLEPLGASPPFLLPVAALGWQGLSFWGPAVAGAAGALAAAAAWGFARVRD